MIRSEGNGNGEIDHKVFIVELSADYFENHDRYMHGNIYLR